MTGQNHLGTSGKSQVRGARGQGDISWNLALDVTFITPRFAVTEELASGGWKATQIYCPTVGGRSPSGCMGSRRDLCSQEVDESWCSAHFTTDHGMVPLTWRVGLLLLRQTQRQLSHNSVELKMNTSQTTAFSPVCGDILLVF